MPFGSRKAFSKNPLRSTSSSPSPAKSWLFVINSDIITSTSKGNGNYLLNIPVTNGNDNILAFTDRPDRVAKRVRAESLELSFSPGESGFFPDGPPNAVIDYRDPNTGSRGAAVVEILGARVDNSRGKVLLLDVKEGPFKEIDSEIGKGILPVMKCASIYIDSVKNLGCSSAGTPCWSDSNCCSDGCVTIFIGGVCA
jgi:hypothetical protein